MQVEKEMKGKVLTPIEWKVLTPREWKVLTPTMCWKGLGQTDDIDFRPFIPLKWAPEHKSNFWLGHPVYLLSLYYKQQLLIVLRLCQS